MSNAPPIQALTRVGVPRVDIQSNITVHPSKISRGQYRQTHNMPPIPPSGYYSFLSPNNIAI